MPRYSRCQSPNAIFTERDKWGIWEVCMYCGWDKFIRSQSQKSLECELRESEILRSKEPIYHAMGIG